MGALISEPLQAAGGFDTSAMSAGEPGLPAAFGWRGRTWGIQGVRRKWKESTREGGRATGELYLRRHFYQLRMESGAIWTVYFERQPPRGRPRAPRWFLYTIDDAAPDAESVSG
jgi:hypothetical protein